MKVNMDVAQKYIDYINNTGLEPLPVAAFDDDHEPIGPMVRRALVELEIIQVNSNGIYLRPDLKKG